MDMKCMTCGEPWDWFYIRDEVLFVEKDYQTAKTQGLVFEDSTGGMWRFSPGPYVEECPACFGKEIEPDENAICRAAIATVLGDDIDAFLVECEDMDL